MILPLVVPTARTSGPSQHISDTPPYSKDRVLQCRGLSDSVNKSNKRRVPSSSNLCMSGENIACKLRLTASDENFTCRMHAKSGNSGMFSGICSVVCEPNFLSESIDWNHQTLTNTNITSDPTSGGE